MKRPAKLILSFALLSLAACSNGFETPKPQRQEAEPPALIFLQLAPSAPPSVQTELPPENPSPLNLVWREGYWSYENGQYNWNAGTFIKRPSPTASWQKERWEEHDFGWAFIPGHWK